MVATLTNARSQRSIADDFDPFFLDRHRFRELFDGYWRHSHGMLHDGAINGTAVDDYALFICVMNLGGLDHIQGSIVSGDGQALLVLIGSTLREDCALLDYYRETLYDFELFYRSHEHKWFEAGLVRKCVAPVDATILFAALGAGGHMHSNRYTPQRQRVDAHGGFRLDYVARLLHGRGEAGGKRLHAVKEDIGMVETR